MRSRVAQFGKSNRCFADRQCHRDDINSFAAQRTGPAGDP
jgi:hypothetical protein